MAVNFIILAWGKHEFGRRVCQYLHRVTTKTCMMRSEGAAPSWAGELESMNVWQEPMRSMKQKLRHLLFLS